MSAEPSAKDFDKIILLRPRRHRHRSVPAKGGPRVAPEEHKLIADAYDYLEISRIAEVTLDECQRLDRSLPRRIAAEDGWFAPRRRWIVVIAPVVDYSAVWRRRWFNC